jgi:parallel beta-helix repeat protein
MKRATRGGYGPFTTAGALTLLLAGSVLGCAADEGVSGEDEDVAGGATEDVGSAEQATQKDNAQVAAACGANISAACSVTVLPSGRTFNNLQAAISNSRDGSVLTVRGRCGPALVDNRTNLTIQGPSSGVCGFNGPSTTSLLGVVDGGLRVHGSTNITVRNLNLVNNKSSNANNNGLELNDSITSLASCNCASSNNGSGIKLDGTEATNVTQNLAQANSGNGIESAFSSTIIISNNTARSNTQNGIYVHDATGHVVAGNIATNNGGAGILFQRVTQSIANGNIITGNGVGLDGFIVCSSSTGISGSNVPLNSPCRRLL